MRPILMPVLVIAISAMAAVAAADCVITTRDAGTRVRIDGAQPVELAPGRPAISSTCSVEVLSGSVCLLNEDPSFDKPCPRFSTGSKSTALPSAKGTSVVALLGGFLQGNVQQRRAGKRLSDAEEVPGFPFGDVLMPGKDMLIPLVWLPAGSVTAFVLEDTVARTKSPMPIEAGAIRIPHRNLAVGRSYRWQATIGGQPRTGSFTTVRPAEQVDLNEQLNQIASNPDYRADPAARAMARAIVLYSEQFAFDALNEISGFVPRP